MKTYFCQKNVARLQKVGSIYFQTMLIFFLGLVIHLLNFMGIDCVATTTQIEQ